MSSFLPRRNHVLFSTSKNAYNRCIPSDMPGTIISKAKGKCQWKNDLYRKRPDNPPAHHRLPLERSVYVIIRTAVRGGQVRQADLTTCSFSSRFQYGYRSRLSFPSYPPVYLRQCRFGGQASREPASGNFNRSRNIRFTRRRYRLRNTNNATFSLR